MESARLEPQVPNLLEHFAPPKGAYMILQVLVVIVAVVAASLLALTIAGATLAAFGKFLKRSEDAREEQRL